MAHPALLLSLVLLLPLTVGAISTKALQPFIGKSYSVMQFRLDGDAGTVHGDFLALALTNSPGMLEGLIPVTQKQTGKDMEPPEWLLVDLVITEGDQDKVLSTVALRNDNLYSVGVTNEDDAWNCFAGVEHLIDGCSPLPFNGNYDGKEGMMARKELGNVELGREAMKRAARAFHAYGTASSATPTTTEAAMKVAMATAALVISEGARFTEIQDLVRAGWENGGVYIPDPERLKFWARISCALAKGWKGKEVEKIEDAFGFGLPRGSGKQAAMALIKVAIYGVKCEKELDALLV